MTVVLVDGLSRAVGAQICRTSWATRSKNLILERGGGSNRQKSYFAKSSLFSTGAPGPPRGNGRPAAERKYLLFSVKFNHFAMWSGTPSAPGLPFAVGSDRRPALPPQTAVQWSANLGAPEHLWPIASHRTLQIRPKSVLPLSQHTICLR